jgi:neutral ceramidase
MTPRATCGSVVLLFLAIGNAAASAQAPAAEPRAASFRAGFARRDVTPREPVPMWGYGARHAALSQGTLDPLYAEALVIEAGGKKLAIVGLDLGRSPGEASLEKVRERIRAGAGIEHSFIAGSHTHHGPVLELTDRPGRGRGRFEAALRYYTQLEDEIVAAVLEADRKLAPATLATGGVQLDGFNRNRHSKRKDPPVDRELAVMRLDAAADGKPIAVVVNFAAHPTSIDAAGLRFSADFVGAMKQTVAAELGGDGGGGDNGDGGGTCGVVFMQGAAGDLSTDRGNRDHAAYGEALGREVVRLAAGLKPVAVARPSLEVREERLTFGSRVDFASPAVALVYGVAFFPELVNNFLDEYADGIRPRLTVALLNGDTALVGVSGEVFSGHALRLKERARARPGRLFFFGYCNGYHQYFPTIEAAAEGGYGADATVAPAEVGAGERVMDAALIRIYEMLGKL